jgi:hypothetical protein
MKSIFQKIYLSHRTNINTKITNISDVVIYEDHRTILNVLFVKKLNNELEFPVNIVLFDNHDDGCYPSEQAQETINKFNKKIPSIEKFWTFVEFELRGLDDDWIKAGMELGLINNVFLFNATQSNFGFVEKYKTKKFGIKKIYDLENVWDSISNRGYFNDVIKFDEYGELWEDFGWVKDENTYKYSFEPENKFIVDFDLDCFSTSVLEKRIAIPKEILFDKMISGYPKDNHYYYNSQDFIKDLIRKAEFTTICFENTFCGGFKESFKIFEYVDELFFDFELE